jgi:hypothetical protein
VQVPGPGIPFSARCNASFNTPSAARASFSMNFLALVLPTKTALSRWEILIVELVLID